MARQSRRESLRDAQNSQRKISRRFSGLEKIPEEVSQMRRKRFIAQWTLASRGHVLQEGCDVVRRDLGQIFGFLSEAETQEAIRHSPAMEDRSVAQAALTTQILFIVQLQASADRVVRRSLRANVNHSEAAQKLDEATDDKAPVLALIFRLSRICDQPNGYFGIEIRDIDTARDHCVGEPGKALRVLSDAVGTVAQTRHLLLKLRHVRAQGAGDRYRFDCGPIRLC